MTIEERQLRAWVRSVFRHAAIRWIRMQGPLHPPTMVTTDNEEEMSWTGIKQGSTALSLSTAPDADARLWRLQCLPRLTAREQRVFNAIYHGWTPQDIAHQLHCDVSTVRRILYRIRRQCPFSDD